jgi:hypothetical protein
MTNIIGLFFFVYNSTMNRVCVRTVSIVLSKNYIEYYMNRA